MRSGEKAFFRRHFTRATTLRFLLGQRPLGGAFTRKRGFLMHAPSALRVVAAHCPGQAGSWIPQLVEPARRGFHALLSHLEVSRLQFDADTTPAFQHGCDDGRTASDEWVEDSLAP